MCGHTNFRCARNFVVRIIFVREYLFRRKYRHVRTPYYRLQRKKEGENQFASNYNGENGGQWAAPNPETQNNANASQDVNNTVQNVMQKLNQHNRGGQYPHQPQVRSPLDGFGLH